jgi:hypothetical protein
MLVVDYTAQKSSFSTLKIQSRRSTSYTRPIGSTAADKAFKLPSGIEINH